MAALKKQDRFAQIKKKMQDGEDNSKDPAVALAKDQAEPVAPAALPAAPVAVAPAPAALAPVATAVPVPAKAPSGAGSTGDVTSPTRTQTQTGGSSPGGASTGGVGSGLGGAGTGGAATGGASTGGAGTVTISISGSSSTETSSGAGSKKSGKGGKSEPKAPITLNISNVGGRTDAGNVASGDGPGASGSGGTAPGGFGGGGGGASPDEPNNFSTSRKDKPKANSQPGPFDEKEAPESYKKSIADQISGRKGMR